MQAQTPEVSGEKATTPAPQAHPLAAINEWALSFNDLWPEDAEEPDGPWILGTRDDSDGVHYPVITIDAWQYDAPGASQKIAQRIRALWRLDLVELVTLLQMAADDYRNQGFVSVADTIDAALAQAGIKPGDSL